jgi:hypothetical protein
MKSNSLNFVACMSILATAFAAPAHQDMDLIVSVKVQDDSHIFKHAPAKLQTQQIC